jgi:hypothetical protein
MFDFLLNAIKDSNSKFEIEYRNEFNFCQSSDSMAWYDEKLMRRNSYAFTSFNSLLSYQLKYILHNVYQS